MKFAIPIAVAVLLVLMLCGTALAAWPDGAQGDQYTAVNAAMENAAAAAGISPETFMAIYNAAITGDLSGFSASEIAAACAVMDSLSSYRSVLTDYDTVYANLGCGGAVAGVSAGTTARGELPAMGAAVAIMLASGALAVGSANRLLRKDRRR